MVHPPKIGGHVRAPLPRFTVFSPGHRLTMYGFFHRWGELAMRVLVPGGHLVIASTPMFLPTVSSAILDAGFELRGIIIRLVQTLRRGWAGALRRDPDGTPFPDVILSERTLEREKAIAPHPTLKPQSFMRRIFWAIVPLEEGEILDPFCGAGSTLAAELQKTFLIFLSHDSFLIDAVIVLLESGARPRQTKSSSSNSPIHIALNLAIPSYLFHIQR